MRRLSDLLREEPVFSTFVEIDVEGVDTQMWEDLHLKRVAARSIS